MPIFCYIATKLTKRGRGADGNAVCKKQAT